MIQNYPIKSPIKMPTEFTQLCEVIKTKLQSEPTVEYVLHHITNQNGISLNWIKVRKSVNQNTYMVNFTKDHEEGLMSEWDHSCPEDAQEDLLSAWGHHAELPQAIQLAFEDANQWDQCRDCDTYCEKTDIPNKCISCVLSNELVNFLSVDQKFECTICNVTKMKSQQKTLDCDHFFCQSCISKLIKPTCPHCRQEIK